MAFSGIYAYATLTNPTTDLSNFIYEIDLSQVTIDDTWWNAWTVDDWTYARAAKGDGVTELPSFGVGVDSTNKTGKIYVLWGTKEATTTDEVRLYPPLTSNGAYAATDTYGRNNVFQAADKGFYPILGDSSAMSDMTVNAQDGTLGTGVTVTDGKLVFDGDSDVTFMSGQLLSGESSFHITFYAKTEDLTDHRLIVFDEFTLNEPFIVWRSSTTSTLAFLLTTENGTTGVIDCTDDMTVGTTHRIDVVYTGSTVTLYLDGVSVGSASITGAVIANDTYSNYTLGWTVNGLYGDMSRIWLSTENKSTDWISYDKSIMDDQTTFYGTWSIGDTGYDINPNMLVMSQIALSTPLVVSDALELPDDTLYVLAMGQSNMQGRYGTGTKFTNSSVTVFNPQTSLEEEWDLTADPTQYEITDPPFADNAPEVDADCPAFYFADEIAKKYGVSVKVLAVTWGGYGNIILQKRRDYVHKLRIPNGNLYHRHSTN